MLAVGTEICTGMPIKIDNPRELGADRLVNAVASYERLGGPCISVDCGTAVNFDVVSAQGEYIGGVLMPGVEISLDALTSRGAKLPRVDLVAPRRANGKGTVDAIRSGVVVGSAAAVDALLGRIQEELEEEAATIATGGLADVVVPYAEAIDAVDDLLTLKGLKLLHERNSA